MTDLLGTACETLNGMGVEALRSQSRVQYDATMRALDLRVYQHQALGRLRAGLKAGLMRQMLCIATGGGKTRIAAALIAGVVAKRKRVWFLSNRLQLIDQTSGVLRVAGIDHGVLQGPNSRFEGMPVMVVSAQTVQRRLKDGRKDWVMPDLVIMDEAHAAASKTYREFIFAHQHIPMVGLSATPFSRGLGRYYAELGGPLFQELVTVISIPDLIEAGFLLDADVYAPSQPDLSGVKTVRRDGESEYEEVGLSKAMSAPELVGDIVTNWLAKAAGRKTVGFAVDIAHSQKIVEEFTSVGVRAKHIDCYMNEKQKRDTIESFRRGEFTVLFCASLLSEGWDDPECSVMIDACPTKSLIRYIQRGGRVLRPFPGKQNAIIMDHAGNCERHGFVTDEREMELHDGNPKKPSASETKQEALPKPCPCCKYMKPAKVKKCPACGFEPKKQSEVEVIDGELSLMKRSKNHKASTTTKDGFGSRQEVWSMLQTAMEESGYSKGWASHKYRTIYGVWPDGLSNQKMPLNIGMRNWLRHEQLKFLKSLPKKGERPGLMPTIHAGPTHA